ncbi:MAG: type VI secretion system tube protein Hcp [Desulfobacteraceae bacterium]|jgi:type VI secretion system secreted protein Hcp
MAFDAFIKFSSIEGESNDDRHKGWIEVLKYGLGKRQHITKAPSSCGGACAGRADFLNLVFKKEIDAATPLLTLACAEGRHIDEVVLDICRAGGEKLSFMQYRFQNCIIQLVSTLGNRNQGLDLVWVDFGKVIWDYTLQSRSHGGPMGHIMAGWDRQTNSRA